MIAQQVTAKVTKRSSYDTELGAYKAAAAVTDKGELVITLQPKPCPNTEVNLITVRFTARETAMVRRALGAR